MAISVDLGERLEATVNDLVSNGRYGSKSEVLREGVRLVEEREAELNRLWALIDEGIAEADAGLGIPAEQVFAELRAQIEARTALKKRA